MVNNLEFLYFLVKFKIKGEKYKKLMIKWWCFFVFSSPNFNFSKKSKNKTDNEYLHAHTSVH